MAVLKITQNLINRGLRCPVDKRKSEVADADCRGLYALLTATNQTWFYRFKNADGRTQHMKIGAVSEVPLADARRQANALRVQVAAGNTMKASREKTQAKELTFTEFFEQRYYPYVVPRKRSHKRDRQLAVRVIRAMGDKKLSEISRLMLSNFHRSLLEVDKLAPSHCDGHIRFIKHALQLACDWSMLEFNPASRFPLFNVDNRSNDFLSDAELKRFVQTVQASSNRVIANLILFMLATGMRLQAAMSIKRCDLDMENRTISIPARSSKSRRLQMIPMSDVAEQAIRSQDANRGDSEFVWVNPRTGDRYKNINKAFHVLRTRARLPTFKIHGLRRAFASNLANQSVPINLIQELLTHASPVTTALYIRVKPSNLLEASLKASSVLRSAMSGTVAL